MAHEMSHVMLRHGTAQATKGEKFQIGAIAGQVLGAIVAAPPAASSPTGRTSALEHLLHEISREYETQADLNGARVMALAGYDPRDMANMFKDARGAGGAVLNPQRSPEPGQPLPADQPGAAVLKVNGHAGEIPRSSTAPRRGSRACHRR